MEHTESIASDVLDFDHWLQQTAGYSKKASRDCISRCKRIETDLLVTLSKAVSSQEKFDILMNDIQIYAKEKSTTKKAAYTLAGTLRAAARKYAHYKYPEKSDKYAAAYGKYKYFSD